MIFPALVVYIERVAMEPQSAVDKKRARKRRDKYGLRTVALFEGLKGLAVAALSCVLISLLHRDLTQVVDHLTDWLRLNPDSRVTDWFYQLADRTTGRGIWTAVSVGFAYSICRFIEGYGLWMQCAWAEWFAVISGAIYLPMEIVAVWHHRDLTHAAILVGNIIVVLFILRILLENRRERCHESPARSNEETVPVARSEK
ncbi:MAG: DUF2127 domain-containing protein [Acidobacteriota bacterium]|nr:DUF2127 domain-containing protein [Acidobacteriota bacterium]